ncbi:MAG: hypothetical protein OEZ55_00380 [Nitrospinota bacterium]|nr:hypothetical protein [Nitrospinota bacterium]MDH5755108.1 hypothetical protein [Nitrospinota bacterium]
MTAVKQDEGITVTEHVVCPFCATLCDDLVIHVQNNQVVKVRNGCNLARGVFENAHKEWATPRVNGKEVPYDSAVEEAARILAASNNPLIYGLAATDVDAQKKCIELADLIGANLDNASSV